MTSSQSYQCQSEAKFEIFSVMRQYLEFWTGGGTLGHTVLCHRQILKNISPPSSFFQIQNIVQFTQQIYIERNLRPRSLYFVLYELSPWGEV